MSRATSTRPERGGLREVLAGTPRDGLKFGEGSSLVSQDTGRGWGYAQHMSNVRADSKPSLTGTADGSNGLRAPKQTYSLTSLFSVSVSDPIVRYFFRSMQLA